MKIENAYNLRIEQTQKLTMTSELVQAITILQYNSQELDEYIQEQLLANPVLEQNESEGSETFSQGTQEESLYEESNKDRLKEQDWKKLIENSTYGDNNYSNKNQNDEAGNNYEKAASNDLTLPENLMFQLQFALAESEERKIGRYIIESLDSNGYMTMKIADISAAINASEEKIEEVLAIIQGFEPAGVGARDIKECLLIQLVQLGIMSLEYDIIVNEHLDDIANNRYTNIAKKMKIDVAHAKELADKIRDLEPKPGRQFATQAETKYITPEIFIEEVDGEYVIKQNKGNEPQLLISSYYRGLLKTAEKDSRLKEYLSDRLNSAVWLIKSIEQRENTIYSVAQSILKHQIDFFRYGKKHLKLLTLRDVAEEVGIHESTVSRAVNGKYLQCHRGLFELKYFFSTGVSSKNGEGIASNSVKEFIKEIIEGEDKSKPYSDEKIMLLLKEKGFNISRRTVAKYREAMCILTSSKRKRY